jgi:hypothetical protein
MWNRALVVLSGLVCVLCACDHVAMAASQTCHPSPTVQAKAPSEPHVGPLAGNWYTNADRTIWAMHMYPWQAGVDDKVPWIRPASARLIITGRRLDGSSPPLKAQVPCCYPTAFQATGMEFPTAGCWEVTAEAGGKVLRFVTEVVPKQVARKERYLGGTPSKI